jgi:hypothetical protein
MHKISVQAQTWNNDIRDYLHSGAVGWFKSINFYPKNLPVELVGRADYGQANVDKVVARGKAGGDEYANWLIPIANENPHVYIWEGPNEPSIWNKEVLAGLAPFNQQLIKRMHQVNKKIMVGQFNTGWPFKPSQDGGKQVDAIGRAIQGADGLGIHEYDAPTMWRDPYNQCLRYQLIWDWLTKRGYGVPPIFITELGIDGGVIGQHKKGWRTVNEHGIPWGTYLSNILKYLWEIQADDRVVAAFLFLMGAVPEWRSFELGREIMDLRVGVDPPPPAPPPEEEEEDPPMATIEDWIEIDRSGTTYKLESWDWWGPDVAGGLVHIFVDVRDKAGKRVPGIPVTMFWQADSSTGLTEQKPDNEAGAINFPMGSVLGNHPPGPYGIRVGNAGESDVMTGMGLGTPETPWQADYTAFILKYRIVEGDDEEPEPEPPPEEPPPDDDLKEAIQDHANQAKYHIEEILRLSEGL